MVKKCLLLAFFFIGMAAQVVADRVKGIVIDQQNKPVAFAYVVAEGKKYATQADKNGHFILELPHGNYLLTASLIGYQKYSKNIAIPMSEEIRMVLDEDYVNLQTVTVTGTMTPKTLANTPVVTRIITADDIRKHDATNIRDVLEAELPGVEYSQAMNRQDVMTMQGLGGKSILFLIDGERMAGETLDNIDFRRMSVDNIERIEIVKGAASALYGSNAVGAVVNIITKSVSEAWTARINTHFESRYSKQRHGAEVSHHKGRWTNIFNLQTDRMKGYTVYDAGNSDSTQVYGNRQWNFKDKLTYKLTDKLSVVGKAGYYFHERNSSPITKDRARDFSGGLRLTGTLGEHDALNVSYNYDRYDKSNLYIKSQKDILDYKNVQNTLHALYTRNVADALVISLGGDMTTDYLMTYQFENNGSKKRFTSSLFAQGDWTISKHWNVVAGLRSDYFSGYGWHLTPKVTAMYSLDKLKIRGSYARGFRAPTLKEMYMNFNMANIFYIFGNEDLKAETSNCFSASAEYAHKNYCFTLTGYYNILNNEITTLWNRSLDNGRGAMVYHNVEGTSLASVDATIVARYGCGIGAKLSYAYFHQFTRHNTPITADSRPHALTAQVDYRKALKNYEFCLLFAGRYLSKSTYSVLSYDRMSYEKTQSVGYSLWKLILTQRIYNAFNLTLGIDNLFNYKPKQYQYNSPFTQGTTYNMTIGVELEKITRWF